MDNEKLEAANLAYKFTPHAATVQVNSKGEVIQAWVKQRTEDRLEEILEAIKDNTPIAEVLPTNQAAEDYMLEIPLFDMHFGIADFEFYKNALCTTTKKHLR